TNVTLLTSPVMQDTWGDGCSGPPRERIKRSERYMAQVTRRRFVGSAAAAGIATAFAGGAVGAASSRWSSPAVIRAQKAPVEIVFSNIWATPSGGDEPDRKPPVERLVEAFNEQSDDVKVISRKDGTYYEGLQKAQAEIAAGNPSALVITPWSNLHF